MNIRFYEKEGCSRRHAARTATATTPRTMRPDTVEDHAAAAAAAELHIRAIESGEKALPEAAGRPARRIAGGHQEMNWRMRMCRAICEDTEWNGWM